MINTNERLKHKYAYNINDSTKIKKVTVGSGRDFLSLTRGFYDDIENNDISIQKKNRQLKRIKNDSLKEFVFTNIKIPDKWRTKLDYQNTIMKMLVKDNTFLSYVGRGGNINKNETISTKMYTRDNFNITGSLKKSRGISMMATSYSQVFPKIDKNKFSFEDKKFGIDMTQTKKFKSIEDEDASLKEIDNSNIGTATKVSFQKGKNKKEIMSDKDVINLLEEFKIAYPIKLPKEEEEQIKKIQEKDDNINKTNLLFSQTFNYNQLLQKNIKYNAFDNFHKIRIKRQRAFRQNIFNNLIPPKQKQKIDMEQTPDKNNYDSSYKKKVMSKSTSFLNTDFESFYKTIKINNPVIKRNLESINFYGPFYSYCPPCLNRNLEFYNNLEPNHCLKLIQYIKKLRKKNILNIKGNNTSSVTNKNQNKKINTFKENNNNESNLTSNEKKDSVELSN